MLLDGRLEDIEMAVSDCKLSVSVCRAMYCCKARHGGAGHRIIFAERTCLSVHLMRYKYARVGGL